MGVRDLRMDVQDLSQCSRKSGCPELSSARKWVSQEFFVQDSFALVLKDKIAFKAILP